MANQYRVLLAVILLVMSVALFAHPEDELCEDASIDPLLCAQLSAMDRPAAKPSSPLPEIALNRSPLETGLLYAKLGFQHILPMGLDHLAFIFALLLACSAFRPIVFYISLFTLAHCITLVCGVLGLVELPELWVEAAIALSIVFVAIENILIQSTGYWRGAMVFGFGLLHGLGFAGALSDIGIPGEHFIGALVGFNIGVELGQLSFAILVFIGLHRFLNKPWYNRVIATPANLCIALTGAYWLFERLM